MEPNKRIYQYKNNNNYTQINKVDPIKKEIRSISCNDFSNV